MIWEQFHSFQPSAVATETSGNVFVTGFTGADMETARLRGTDGTPVWGRRSGFAGSTHSDAMAVDAAGDLVVAGRSGFYGPYYIAKYVGGNGGLLWEQTYPSPGGGTDAPPPVRLVVAADGSVVVASSMDFGTVIGTPATDFVTVKYVADTSQPLVVLNEIHYAPSTNGDEFVEIKNCSPANVALFSGTRVWQIRGLDYALPADIQLGPSQFLLLVATNPASFRARYGISDAVPILGPYRNALANFGQELALEAPAEPTGTNYFTVDGVRYGSQGTWPVAADGRGASLQRLNPDLLARSPASWVAAMPTPGADYPGGESPRILEHPAGTTALAGQSVTLRASAAGTEPLHYRWTFQGAPIVSGTNSTLVLDNVQFSHAGDYWFLVYNPAGSVTSAPARLLVSSRLAIVTPPTNQLVAAGSTASFSVEAIASAPLRYQWRKSGSPINNATNPALVIENVQAAQQGSYSCTVSAGNDSTTSSAAQLSLVYPPVITQHPEGLTVAAGERVSFFVQVTNNATLPIAYRWIKDGVTLATVSRNDRSCSFTLFAVTPDASPRNGPGTYWVVASNSATAGQPIISQLASLTVTPLVRPEILTQQVMVLGAQHARLSGQVRIHGSQTMAWFEYGPTPEYGSTTPAQDLGPGDIRPLRQRVDGLLPGTEYHYRLVATNRVGITFGQDALFLTDPAGAPVPIHEYGRDETFFLEFEGQPRGAYAVEATTNLASASSWALLGAATEGDQGWFYFFDADAPLHPARFYRVTIQWTLTSAPILNWTSVASSADGSKLIAVADDFPGAIYLSTDSGQTWNTPVTALSGKWTSVASSADGTRLIVVGNDFPSGPVCVSTDSGATWTQTTAPASSWIAAATSADGTRFVIASDEFPIGPIYFSGDAGTSWWQADAPATKWTSLAASADGSKLLAVGDLGLVYRSTNGGESWTETSAPANPWIGAASSADGRKLLIVGHSFEPIYVSSDAGQTWSLMNAPLEHYSDVASSADGTKLVAASAYVELLGYLGRILVSNDSGQTWLDSAAPNLVWSSVASSADGTKLVAVARGGGIYVRQPRTHVGRVRISRRVDSGSFVLQFEGDPGTRYAVEATTDLDQWAEVGVAREDTPGHFEFIDQTRASTGARFYRLRAP